MDNSIFNQEFILQILKDYPVLATVVSGGTLGIIWRYGIDIWNCVKDAFLWCVSFSTISESLTDELEIANVDFIKRHLMALKKMGGVPLIQKSFSIHTGGELWELNDKLRGIVTPSLGSTWFWFKPFGLVKSSAVINTEKSTLHRQSYVVTMQVFFMSKYKFLTNYSQYTQLTEEEKEYKKSFINTTEGQLRKRPLSSVYTNSNIGEYLLEDLKRFIKNKDYYIKHHIPYKRNYLLYGPPGTGKTSLIKALVSELDLKLYFLTKDMFENDNGESFSQRVSNIREENTIDTQQFISDVAVISSVNSGNPYDQVKVRLMEDLENCDIYKGSSSNIDANDDKTQLQETISQACSLLSPSKSKLLNFLDGFQTPEGSIMFFTTNHIEMIDPAILRDGRMDVKIELDYLNPVTANRMLQESTNNQLGIDSTEIKKDVCPAFLQEVINQFLLGGWDKEICKDKLREYL